MRFFFKKLKRTGFLCLFAGVSIVAAVPAKAQQDYEDYTNYKKTGPQISLIQPVEPIEDEYVPPSFENLSKMYWALGKFDVTDTEAINNYLMINECGLYEKFYFNDFEWEGIRNATRRYISDSLTAFPTKFEIIRPIGLDRYDVENEVFYLQEDDAYKGARKFDISMNKDTDPICDKPGIIPGYPRNIILTLNRPLVLEKFPVKPELAEMFLEEARKNFENLPHFLKVRKYERVAYLRLKVSLFQYKETVIVNSGYERASIFGRLEGIEIYADPDKMKPLYMKDIKDRRLRRRRSASADDEPDLSVDSEDELSEETITEE